MNRWIFVFAALLALSSCKKEGDPQECKPSDTTPVAEPWDGMPALDDVVMYEVNLRAFPGGNLQGVIGKLDFIESLGVNTIWLMPLYPIGTTNSVNSPYSISDYTAVASEYGSFEDLTELVTEAHNRGMAVLLDWVANHTSWDHAWISAHPNWYTQDANGNIIHPEGTNWQDVADLNYEVTDMRQAMIEEMAWWIETAGIDGYRCDAADWVPVDFWQQAITSLRTNHPDNNLLFLAEGVDDALLTSGFDMNFGWNWYGELIDTFEGAPANNLFGINWIEEQGQPQGSTQLRFTTNHDESAWDVTPPVKFGSQEAALSAFAITTFMGGVPLVYGSQEVGQEDNVPFFWNAPIDFTQNPEVLSSYQEILTIYTNHPAARTGTVQDASNSTIVCLSRTQGDDQVLLAANTRNTPQTLTLSPDLQTLHNLPETITLEAYQYLLHTN